MSQQDPNDSTVSLRDQKLSLSEKEWQSRLSPESFRVLRQRGTEPPFSGEYCAHFTKGIYQCGGCGEDLFHATDKFDAGCGWPSFARELAGNKIVKKADHSHGMTRTEIICARCDGHLGHVFDDGPTETGLRYCVNSYALIFQPEGAQKK